MTQEYTKQELEVAAKTADGLICLTELGIATTQLNLIEKRVSHRQAPYFSIQADLPQVIEGHKFWEQIFTRMTLTLSPLDEKEGDDILFTMHLGWQHVGGGSNGHDLTYAPHRQRFLAFHTVDRRWHLIQIDAQTGNRIS